MNIPVTVKGIGLRSRKGKGGAVKTTGYSFTPVKRSTRGRRQASPPALPVDTASINLREAEPELEPEPEPQLHHVDEMAAHPTVSVEFFTGKPGAKGQVWLKGIRELLKNIYRYDDEKVNATFHLFFKDHAKTWYESLTDEIRANRDELITQFQQRFDGTGGGFSVAMVRQKSNESVYDYSTRYQDLANGSGMPDQWLIGHFIDGLIPTLRKIVKPQDISSLEAARKAALRAEASQADTVEVNMVGHSTDRKLDILIDLMTRQMTLSEQPGPEPTRDTPSSHQTGGYLWKTFLCSVLIISLISPSSATSIIPRLNYGVAFQEEAKLTLAREYWLHTYELNLPEHINIPSLGSCHQDNNTCLLVSQVLTQLNSIRLETEARLNNTLLTVHKLVPHADFVHKTRSTRALLGFIGKFSKTLFGTATVEDVQILAKHINALIKRTKSFGDALTQHNEHLSSYMQQSNKRMDNLMEGIRDNNMAIHYITTQLKITSSSLQKSFEEMTSVLIHQLQTSNQINHQLDELKLGILDLANGKLSPLIIPLETLQASLNDVQAILSKNYPGFFVATKAASDLYHNSNFLYTRKDSLLYVTVKIPISNSDQALDLYKIISKPVPINDTSNHATQILNLPDYFAVTKSQQFYIKMSQSQVNLCKGKHHKHCHLNLPLSPVLKDSCTLALFANAKDKIKNLCQFRFVHDVIKPEIQELSSNKVLSYKSPVLSMECNNKHKLIQGCNFCILDLPCQCSLSSTDFYLPPRLISCKNTTNTNITKLHPVNLVLLQQFFDDKQFQHIFADTNFQNPLNVSVPKFKIYEHKMSNVLAADERNHLNLSKMVEIAKNDGIVFQTLAEPILDGHVAIQTQWPDLNGILVLVSVCLASISTVLLVYLFCRVRTLSATILVLQQSIKTKAMASTMPSFIYQHKQASAEPNFNFETPVTLEQLTLILVLFNTVVLLIIVLKLFKRKTNPMLILEITNMKQCVFVDLAKLPLCPSHINLTMPESITELRVSGSLFRPKLSITWSDFMFEDELSEILTNVPENISINPWQARKLAKMLQTPFKMHFYTAHNGYLSSVSPTN